MGKGLKMKPGFFTALFLSSVCASHAAATPNVELLSPKLTKRYWVVSQNSDDWSEYENRAKNLIQEEGQQYPDIGRGVYKIVSSNGLFARFTDRLVFGGINKSLVLAHIHFSDIANFCKATGFPNVAWVERSVVVEHSPPKQGLYSGSDSGGYRGLSADYLEYGYRNEHTVANFKPLTNEVICSKINHAVPIGNVLPGLPVSDLNGVKSIFFNAEVDSSLFFNPDNKYKWFYSAYFEKKPYQFPPGFGDVLSGSNRAFARHINPQYAPLGYYNDLCRTASFESKSSFMLGRSLYRPPGSNEYPKPITDGEAGHFVSCIGSENAEDLFLDPAKTVVMNDYIKYHKEVQLRNVRIALKDAGVVPFSASKINLVSVCGDNVDTIHSGAVIIPSRPTHKYSIAQAREAPGGWAFYASENENEQPVTLKDFFCVDKKKESDSVAFAVPNLFSAAEIIKDTVEPTVRIHAPRNMGYVVGTLDARPEMKEYIALKVCARYAKLGYEVATGVDLGGGPWDSVSIIQSKWSIAQAGQEGVVDFEDGYKKFFKESNGALGDSTEVAVVEPALAETIDYVDCKLNK